MRLFTQILICFVMDILLLTTREGNKGDSQHIPGMGCSTAIFLDYDQFLTGKGKTHRNNQPGARLELI